MRRGRGGGRVPGGGGDGGRAVAFTGYAPRRPGIENPALFSCFVDNAVMQPGDEIVVLGSCEALHGWDVGLALHRNARNPNLWSRTIIMPFTTKERSYGGIFQYKFGIRNVAGDVFEEPGEPRTVRSMVTTYFASLRPLPRFSRIEGFERTANRDVAEQFLTNALADYEICLLYTSPSPRDRG